MFSRSVSPVGNVILYHKVETSYKNGQNLHEIWNLSILCQTACEAAMMGALSRLQTQVRGHSSPHENAVNSHGPHYLNVGLNLFLAFAYLPCSCCTASTQAVRLAVGAQPETSFSFWAPFIMAEWSSCCLLKVLAISENRVSMAGTFTSFSVRVPSLLKTPGEIKNVKEFQI